MRSCIDGNTSPSSLTPPADDVDLNHAVARWVGVFFQFDVISDQEALEVCAHAGPKRAIHSEQQGVRGGPHVCFGNQVGALVRNSAAMRLPGMRPLMSLLHIPCRNDARSSPLSV